MKKEKVIFIINPIAGSRSKAALPQLIEQHLDHQKYELQLVFTDFKGQGSEITNLAVANGASIIVAVGGDGTVNEIGKMLIDTKACLGILPAGSGNGLARHLKIPLDLIKAIKVINQGKKVFIDAGKMNGKFFFCTSGVGFDAHIGDVFATKVHRGFQGYIKTTLKEFNAYQPQLYKLTLPDKELVRESFLITIANASQYGNNAFIAPHANIQDHLLDICIMKKFPPIAALDMGIRIFTKRIQFSKYVEFLQLPELTIERPLPGIVHVDGEPFQMDARLDIRIVPGGLQVLAP